MARTLLFKQLKKTLTQHYYFDKYLPDFTPNRRQFIGAAAGLSLAGCGAIKTKAPTDLRVVVVGAGLAGVHCAYRLQQSGATVALYEAANRTGGRTFSSKVGFFEGGQVCELGGELIDTDHVVMQSFAGEFGLQLDNLPLSLPKDVRYGYQYNIDGEFLTQQQVIEAYAPIDKAVQKVNYEFSRIEQETPEKLDQARIDFDQQTSLVKFLDDNGASELLKKVIRFAFVGEFGLEMEEQSVFNLLDLFPCSSNIGACVANYELVDGELEFRPFGNSDEIMRFNRGNEGPARAMTERLKSHLFLEHALTSIDYQKGRYYLAFTTPSGEIVRDSAEHIVLALPFSTLRKVTISESALSAANIDVINNVSYGTNSKLMGQFKNRKPWRDEGHDGSLVIDQQTTEGRDLHNLWDTSRGQASDYGLWTNFVGGKAGFQIAKGEPQAQWQTMLPVLDKVYPGVKQNFLNKATRMLWPTYRWTQGSYMAIKPGALAYSTYMPTEDNNGTVQFCGEHTSEAFQGFMEGAAETGARAALALVNKLGLTPSPELQTIERLMASREAIHKATRQSLLAAMASHQAVHA